MLMECMCSLARALKVDMLDNRFYSILLCSILFCTISYTVLCCTMMHLPVEGGQSDGLVECVRS